MSDTAIGTPAPPASASSSSPASAPARPAAEAAARASNPAANGALDGGFGPAVVVGGAAPPAEFSVYTANGTFGPDVANAPTLRLSAPTVDFSGEFPPSKLYERLGRIIYQIQLAFRGGGLGGAYTLGYSLKV